MPLWWICLIMLPSLILVGLSVHTAITNKRRFPPPPPPPVYDGSLYAVVRGPFGVRTFVLRQGIETQVPGDPSLIMSVLNSDPKMVYVGTPESRNPARLYCSFPPEQKTPYETRTGTIEVVTFASRERMNTEAGLN